jgi:hypothetical protein
VLDVRQHSQLQSKTRARPRGWGRRGDKKATGSRRAKESNAFSIDPKRPVKSYDMNNSFSAGDVINHPKFGLGAVETALPPNKIEVRFQEGKKMLLHNMRNFRY